MCRIATGMRGTFLRFLNLVLAPLQIVVTVVAFSLGTSFEEATASSSGEPPIIPAGYAFTVWSVIYAGSVLYAIYQFPRRRLNDPLLSPIRAYTASAFAATASWLVAARFNQTGVTVVCIFWLLASLLPAFLSFMRRQNRLTWTERLAVTSPLSIYTGWVTVAVFANVSAWLYRHGLLNVLFTPALWAAVMVLVAGTLAAWLVKRSASLPFTLTVCWALVAILVANLTREYHPEVVVACGVMTAVDLGALVMSRLRL
jgi:translocator protein